MSEGGQAHESGRARDRASDQDPEERAETETSSAEDTRDLLDDVDELLDEIDDVLEENAEEFVRGYVQKGGQ